MRGQEVYPGYSGPGVATAMVMGLERWSSQCGAAENNNNRQQMCFLLLSLSIPFCMTNINKCKHTLPHSLCAPYSGSISIINLLPPADNKDKTTMEPRLSHHIVRTSLCNVTRPPHETIFRCSGVSSTQD